jgi:hypothetical protein
MHEVEIYRGDDTSLIEALERAMGRFCVEVHVRPALGSLTAAFGEDPISSVVLTPIHALKSEILNELRRVPDYLAKYAEGIIDGYASALGVPFHDFLGCRFPKVFPLCRLI